VATVLHVSPHPDDEALGAPVTLLLLRRAGWHVVNLVTSLGHPGDADRRRGEAIEAATRGGFELLLPDGRDVAGRVSDVVTDHAPVVVVSPWVDDAHPRHEAVARAVGDALAATATPPVWWQWGLWADLRQPTLYVPFGANELTDARHVLAAYDGELARNDYNRLLEARAVAHAVLGSERVFGFGRARASAEPYAELLTELRFLDGAWHRAEPRRFDVRDPLGRGT
jgi:LmbE family N-acetylglucosaminyl deacetylase